MKVSRLASVSSQPDLRRHALLATMLVALCASPLAGAAAPTLSPQTLQYVKYAQPVLAITHVRVIDGNGSRAKDDQTVLLRDGLIAAIGSRVKVPKDATVIDGKGRTLIPGLVGMHDHMFYPAPKVNPLRKLRSIWSPQAR